MANKTYTNKSSMDKFKSRYNQGGDTDVFSKRLGWWERDIEIEKNHVTDIVVKIDNRYNKRPDLVAYDYYGRTKYMWVVLQYNDIVDIETEFIAGKEISIPSAGRLHHEILTK